MDFSSRRFIFLYDRLYNFYTEKMMYFYMTKSTKSQKEEGNSCLGDAVQRWLRHPEPSSWSLKSARIRKVSLSFFAGRRWRRPLQDKIKVPSTAKAKIKPTSAFSFADAAAKEKAIKKKSAEIEISRSAEHDKCSFTPSRRRRHTCEAYVSIPLTPQASPKA